MRRDFREQGPKGLNRGFGPEVTPRTGRLTLVDGLGLYEASAGNPAFSQAGCRNALLSGSLRRS